MNATAWPKVSIVIPVRNDAARLAVCLESLRQQDYARELVECIVVDNGSQDDSATIARQLGATVLSFPKLRVGGLRNRGVDIATGEILAFVDADHELSHDWLRQGVSPLLADASLVMCGAPCIAPPRGTWVQRTWEIQRLRNSRRQFADWLGAGNMFVRRANFMAVHGFKEDLTAAEDVDLCLRIVKQGKILSDPSIVNIHHGEPASLWQFMRKEYWRGSSGVWAFIQQGFPLRELPSLLWPLYHLLALLALLSGIAWGIRTQNIFIPLIAWGMLLLPAGLLALKTAFQTGRWASVVGLWMLYLAYGFARAAALFKA